jgi:hypothetical protein
MGLTQQDLFLQKISDYNGYIVFNKRKKRVIITIGLKIKKCYYIDNIQIGINVFKDSYFVYGELNYLIDCIVNK